MPTPRRVIERLFPSGTNPGGSDDQHAWDIVPYWPPDAFAAAATLVSLSGCYSQPRYAGGGAPGLFTADQIREVMALGRTWSRLPQLGELQSIQELWEELIDEHNRDVDDVTDPRRVQWCDAALRLMAVADEASSGIGFFSLAESAPVEAAFRSQYERNSSGRPSGPNEVVLPYIPFSLTRMVPPTEACVQPKAQAPQLGCTLRSLSHHLALLPPSGTVRTSWRMGVAKLDDHGETGRPLNVLIVPFPYTIPDGCLEAGEHVRRDLIEDRVCALAFAAGRPGEKEAFRQQAEEEFGPRTCYFSVRQRWLQSSGRGLTPQDLANFLVGLIDRTRAVGRPANAVILPELALADPIAREAARLLGQQYSDLELFIAGVATDESLPRNRLYGCVFQNGSVLTEWTQSKHHRWRLDSSQIGRYQLGNALDPGAFWWEGINIGERECVFHAFRPRVCLAALICEDLARLDPVQPVIRAVGPNILIALLMDGPQISERWPGRYATVLADDPGSAVLTLTSLGLMRRQSGPGEQEYRQVALWKEPDPGLLVDQKLVDRQRRCKNPRPLWLATGSHALLLTLDFAAQKTYTLDGRPDRQTAMTAVLPPDGVLSITHPHPAPVWVE